MLKSLPAAILVVCIAASRLSSLDAAKILGLFAHPSESHFAVMRSIMTELTKRQHTVTIFSSHPLTERVENLEEFVIEPEYQFWHELQKATNTKGDFQKLSQLPVAVLQKAVAATGASAVDYFLSNNAFQKLLKTPAGDASFDYDLIIVDLFYTDALLTLGFIHNVPTIGIVSSNYESYMDNYLDNYVPIACSPNDPATFVKDVGFWGRLANTRNCIARRKQFAKVNADAQENLIKKHFAHYKVPMPTIAELQSNLALLLFNNHVPLATPRPLLQNTIAAGGLHIRAPRELPWHIRRFLDEARSGVIYMNMGNEQLCTDIPKDKLQILFNVFSKYKERVLWTCHDVQQMENLPKNMLIQHAVPQTDILAHPHVKIFVMNGDLLSVQEGIVRHVPMIGVPLFRNELANAKLTVLLGVGVRVDYSNLTEASLTWALQVVLSNTNLPLRIREVSREFRDRPLGALETSMYWIDYVLRHNGGAQIKTAGIGSSSSHLHLFDLFLFYFAVALSFVSVLLAIYYAVLLLRKRQQVKKMYNKLN